MRHHAQALEGVGVADERLLARADGVGQVDARAAGDLQAGLLVGAADEGVVAGPRQGAEPAEVDGAPGTAVAPAAAVVAVVTVVTVVIPPVTAVVPPVTVVAAVVAAVVALAETRSFLGGAVLALLALAGATRFARARHLVLGLAFLGIAVLVPRAAAIVAGEDSSTAARLVYLRAGWQGALERPVVGWGPGATAWTLAEHLHPLPAVNPPGEVVGEMHSLPVELAYELGFPGLALAVTLASLFLFRCWRRRGIAPDRGLVEAGLAGVVGFLLTALGGAQLTVTALPLAAALAAGAALAGEGAEHTALSQSPRQLSWPVWLYVGAAALALLPLARAHALYEQAATLRVRTEAAPLLARSMALDPEFALYRARWAWSATSPLEERALEAIAAARSARGVASLWLRAGALALEAGRRDLAREASSQALKLDPLGGFAPFQLATLSGDGVDCAARGLLAEPRLAAATSWRGHDGQRRLALQRLERWPGIDTGWKEEFLQQAATAVPAPLAPGTQEAAGAAAAAADEVDLAAQIDTTPALAVSLHLFRRSPWPADVARIRVERAAVRRMKLPSAATLPESAAAAFPRDRCAPL